MMMANKLHIYSKMMTEFEIIAYDIFRLFLLVLDTDLFH